MNTNEIIELIPLLPTEYEEFVARNKKAYLKAIIEEFGEQENDPVSAEGIKLSVEHPDSESFNILLNNKVAGGVVVRIDKNSNINCLDHIFVDDEIQSRGIGSKVWEMIEKKYPETIIWETHTPYYEIRNIHFYVNKCGFKIVEFYNPYHPEPDDDDSPGGVMFFRLEKEMK